MAFTLPDFNQLLYVWRTPRTPEDGPPDEAEIPCQIYLASRLTQDITDGAPEAWKPPIILRCPSESFHPEPGDLYLLQIHDTDYYYLYRFWEYIHVGFPNEYQFVIVSHCGSDREVPYDQ